LKETTPDPAPTNSGHHDRRSRRVFGEQSTLPPSAIAKLHTTTRGKPTKGDTILNLHLNLLYRDTWPPLGGSLTTMAPSKEEGRGAGRLGYWTTLKGAREF
jgi:hypothetical protein